MQAQFSFEYLEWSALNVLRWVHGNNDCHIGGVEYLFIVRVRNNRVLINLHLIIDFFQYPLASFAPMAYSNESQCSIGSWVLG